MAITFGQPPQVDRIEINWDEVETFKSEEDFTGIAVSLLVESASYVCIAANTTGKEPSWDRDQACVGGHMVRLYKLLDSFLDQTVKRRQEISVIFARLIFETAVNAKFLIENFSPEIVESYITYSLRHERRLWDNVESNIAARGGVVLPIEDRMFKSIDRAARAAGIPLTSVDPANRTTWGGSFYGRTKATGYEQLYLAAFGGGSHSIHGNWQDLYGDHLHWDDQTNRFTPNVAWSRPRPQFITTLAHITIDAALCYFMFIGGDDLGIHFEGPIGDLHTRITRLSNAHEKYLAAKAWPTV